MKKIIITFVMVLFVAICTIFYTNKVNADTVASSEAIEVLGAQIRTTGNQGLRFVSHVDYNTLDINEETITKYGTVVAYGEANVDELYLGATVNQKSVKYGESESLFNEDLATFTVVLYNISEEQLLQDFTARAYIKYMEDGIEKIIYSNNVCKRSIYEIAKLAYDNGNHHDFIFNIINTVDTKISDVMTIQEAKETYLNDSTQAITIRGVVTVLSTGTYKNAVISDETGSLVVFRLNNQTTLTNVTNILDIIKVGNEVVLTGKITIYNGLYEINEGTITKCFLTCYGNKIDSYQNDISLMETVDVDDQGKLVRGFAKYVSRSSNTLTFTLDNNFTLYVDQKWSTYTATSLETNKYYYINGFVSWYNNPQIIPYSIDNAISTISSLTLDEELNSSYVTGSFDLTNYHINVTLSNNDVLRTPITLAMFLQSDLDKLTTAGTHELTLNYYDSTLTIEVTLIDKEVSSIVATIPNLTYYTGDTIDLTNASINITYVDNTSETKAITSAMISNFSTDTKKTAELTVTYKEVATTVTYEVLAPRTTSPVIIYEIYGGGGNSEATYNYDFVVLYNTTSQKIDLSDYYLQYAASGSTTLNSSYAKLSGNIYEHSYCLIRLESNNIVNGSDLPFYTLDFAGQSSPKKFELAESTGQITLAYGTVAVNTTDSCILEYVKYKSLTETKSYKRTSTDVFEFAGNSVDLSYLSTDAVIMDIQEINVKTRYSLNEALDLSTLSFKVFYSNGNKETVTVESSAVSGFDTSAVGTFTMHITVLSRTLNIDYYVNSGVVHDLVNIYYIDLGANISDCGEAAYIKIGDNIDILIDCGESNPTSASCVNSVLSTYVTDNTLEYVIATHGHSDHIGGMPLVLCNYNITNVVEFYYKFGSTETSNTVIGRYLAARKKATNIYTAYELIGNNNSYTMNITDEISCTFYNTGYLADTDTNDKNKQSVVCCFDIYGSRVLFNGDSEKEQEAIYAPLVGDVDIFKLGHHGTYNATSAALLDYITPEVAIVCNGNYLGNKYGHPTHEALSRIYAYSRSCDIYAITGAAITSTKPVSKDMTNFPFEISSQDATITSNVLTAYKRSNNTYKFQYNMTEYNDALTDRNGIINITFDGNGYEIKAEKTLNNVPIEMSDTAYYQNLMAYLVSVGTYTQNKANSLMHN